MAENEELLVEDELDESDEPIPDLDNGLSDVQNRALLALLSTKNNTAAAKKAGVARSTLYNWLDEPEFRAQWIELRTRRFSSAISRLQNMADDSVEVLSKMIAAEKTPAGQSSGRHPAQSRLRLPRHRAGKPRPPRGRPRRV